MLSPGQLEDLLSLRMPEPKAIALLEELKPERVDLALLQYCLSLMKSTAEPVPTLEHPVLDCCGTGGSGYSLFNTSTAVAFVLAAGGVPVVKFGNRAITSQSGSFDFLEQLGFSAEIPLNRVPDLLKLCNLAFVYAPQCYPSLRPLTQLRRKLPFTTIFNFLGPLLNPFLPAYRLLGVSNARMQQQTAHLLAQEPTLHHALVLRGIAPERHNLDELDYNGETEILQVREGHVESHVFETKYPDTLIESGHSPIDAAKRFQAMVAGMDGASPYYRMVCLNAGAGFFTAGLSTSIEAGAEQAEALFREGLVKRQLDRTRRAYASILR